MTYPEGFGKITKGGKEVPEYALQKPPKLKASRVPKVPKTTETMPSKVKYPRQSKTTYPLQHRLKQKPQLI